MEFAKLANPNQDESKLSLSAAQPQLVGLIKGKKCVRVAKMRARVQDAKVSVVNADNLDMTPTFIFFRVCVGVLGVPSENPPSVFKDIIQIEVDPPPSHLIFDKSIFDKVLIMLTSLPPLEFLTKIMTF